MQAQQCLLTEMAQWLEKLNTVQQKRYTRSKGNTPSPPKKEKKKKKTLPKLPFDRKERKNITTAVSEKSEERTVLKMNEQIDEIERRILNGTCIFQSIEKQPDIQKKYRCINTDTNVLERVT